MKAFALAVGTALLLSGCGKQSSNEPTQNAGQQQGYNEQLAKCISVAQNLKYNNGQCAYNLIKKCVETGSRAEMESAYKLDHVSGDSFNGFSTCSYNPSTYVQAFDRF